MCHIHLRRNVCHSGPVGDPRLERTRRRALAAGRALFVAGGLDAVTHLRVSEAGGGARRTLYRHWPDTRSLLRDVLAEGEVPHADRCGDLRTDLLAHLDALRRALVDGHLGLVVSALGERAAVDPSFEPLRAELTEAGCAPLRALLDDAVRGGALRDDLDRTAALAALEGPIFYRAWVRRERVPATALVGVVDAFLASPPRTRHDAAAEASRTSDGSPDPGPEGERG
jgi:AcrR family transcriptional regulator